jgi:hypothetical protein
MLVEHADGAVQFLGLLAEESAPLTIVCAADSRDQLFGRVALVAERPAQRPNSRVVGHVRFSLAV